MPLSITYSKHAIHIGEHVSISFLRTLRIPDDDKTYPLPPGLSSFPIYDVSAYADTVPAKWEEQGGYFIPMYQREALWMSFQGAYWRPNALKVAVGGVDALTGDPFDESLIADPQNYMVIPDQPWLDGINAGDGFIRQFVAMPLGMGSTVEGQLTGKETEGGIQFHLFEPKPGKFPEEAPADRFLGISDNMMLCDVACESAPVGGMGLGAGGKMKQDIYDDTYGLDTWNPDDVVAFCVHIVDSLMFRDITGEEPPSTPVSAKLYTQYGYPWFDLYDEKRHDIPASGKLAGVKSVKEMDQQKGLPPMQDDSTVPISGSQVVDLPNTDDWPK